MRLDARQTKMLELMGIPMGWLKVRAPEESALERVAPKASAPVAIDAPSASVKRASLKSQLVDAGEQDHAQSNKPAPRAEPKTSAANADANNAAVEVTHTPMPDWSKLSWAELHKACKQYFPHSAANECIWGNVSVAEQAPTLPVPLMVVLDPDYASAVQHGVAQQQPALRLLGNMLAALGWSWADVCITSWQRQSTAVVGAQPTADVATAWTAILRRQAQLLQCRHVLVFDGAEALTAPVGDVAQTSDWGWVLHTCPHPSKLLRKPVLKTEGWLTLCQLAEQLSALEADAVL